MPTWDPAEFEKEMKRTCADMGLEDLFDMGCGGQDSGSAIPTITGSSVD